MKLNTKAVDRSGNRYCGPLVLAALLKCSTAEATAAVRRVTGSDGAIKGMHNRDVLRTLQAHGYACREEAVPKVYKARRPVGVPLEFCVEFTDGRSFQTFRTMPDGTRRETYCMRQDLCSDTTNARFTPVKRYGVTFAAWLRQRGNKAGTYLVNVTGHYVLVSGRKFVDTYTKGEWVNIGKAPHRRTRVEHVWEITK